jgi:lipopolysaccharide export system permease protein
MSAPSTSAALPRGGRLTRYLWRRWWRTALGFSLAFVAVLMLLYAAEVMGEIAGGELPVSMLGWQLLLYLPEALRTVLPLGMGLAVLLVRQQMRRDAEWHMLTFAGLTPGALRAALAGFMLPGAAIVFVLGGWLQPAALELQAALYQRAANSAEFWGILPGRFNTLPDNGGVVYAAAMDREGRAVDVFLRLQDAQGTQLLTSADGRFRMQPDGERYVVLERGRRAFEAADGELQLLDFERAEVRLPVPDQVALEADQRAWPWSRLLASGDRVARAEMQWRMAHAVMMLVLLAWLAFLLRGGRPRPARDAVDLAVLMLLYIVYQNLLNLAAVWIGDGRLGVLPGYWWVHGLLLAPLLAWLRVRRRTGRPR